MILEIIKEEKVQTVVDTIDVPNNSCYLFGLLYLKFYNGKCLKIFKNTKDGTSSIQIQEADSEVAWFVKHGSPISEDEFNNVYCEVHNEFANLQLNLA